MMALRLLILRAVEQLSHVDKKHRKAQSDASLSNLILSLALFTEIVDVVRRCTTNLQFASLFLEVGRQIEPGFLAHLFPLPQSHSESPKQSETSKRRKSRACLTDKSLVDRFNARTVDDLFSLCIHEGSLAASASALPLLSRMQSRSYCDLLLERAITAFVHNIDSTDATFDRTQEERRVIGDLFRFGVKLEDAEALEGNMLAQEFHEESLKEAREKLIAEGTAVQTVTNGNFGSVDDGAAYSTDDDDSRCYGQNASNRNLICVGGGKRESFILNYMIHSIFDDGNKVSEEAIRRAASSFIESKQDLVSMDFLTLGADDASGTADTDDGNDDYWSNSDSGVSRDPNASKHIGKPGKNIKSVATLVGDVMHELLKAPKIDHPWKAMSSLARLIVQHSNDLPPLDVFTTAMQQTRKSTLEAVLPSGYETEESSDQLVRFLVAEIGRCEFQIESSVQEPAWVVDLALILLQRLLSDSKCSEELLSSLVLIALIAGHVSGRAEELLEPIHDTPSYLVNCYKTAHLNTCTI